MTFRILIVLISGPLFTFFPTIAAETVPLSNINLVKGANFLASSFKGTTDRTVKTDSYYENLGDGKVNTFWRPMDKEAPHWIEMHWRYPLVVSRFVYRGRGLKQATLSVWHQGQWRPAGALWESQTILTFPKKRTRRLRLDITEATHPLELSELEVYGLEQPIPPRWLLEAKKDAPEEALTIADIKITPKKSGPGGKVKVSFSASSSRRLQKDYYFLADIKEIGVIASKGNFEIASAIGTTRIRSSKWKPRKKYPVIVEFNLPDYTPQGKSDIKIAAISWDGKHFAAVGHPKQLTQKLGAIEVERNDKIKQVDTAPTAKLVLNNGQRGFEIGGKFHLPFFMRYMYIAGFERFYGSRSNGINIQYFLMYNRCMGLPSEWQIYFDQLDQNISNMLRVRPNSYFMIGIDLRTNPAWLRANPKELMIDAFGEKSSPAYKGEAGVVSFGSKKI